MWLPQNVSRTKNAKYAFLGTLYAIYLWNLAHSNNPINHLVCSGLCTGYGKMKPEESAKQIKEAFLELDLTSLQPYHMKWFNLGQIYFHESPKVVKEQPKYYQNSQWKTIDPSQIELA